VWSTEMGSLLPTLGLLSAPSKLLASRAVLGSSAGSPPQKGVEVWSFGKCPSLV